MVSFIYKNIFLYLISFFIFFFPKFIYLFFFSKKECLLPLKKNRLKFSNNLFDDFRFNTQSLPTADKVNLIFRGNIEKDLFYNIDKTLPTFFVNPNDIKLIQKLSNPIVITQDFGWMENFLKKYSNDNLKFCLISNNSRGIQANNIDLLNSNDITLQDLQSWQKKDFNKSHLIDYPILLSHNSRQKNIAIASGVGATMICMKHYKNVNAYGLDQYISTNINNSMTILVNNWKLGRFGVAINILSFYYFKRIMNENNNTIVHGNINYINKFNWINNLYYCIYK